MPERAESADSANAAAAFAALEAILAGEWDRYLLRIRGAIRQRMETEEYERHIIASRPRDC
jgi:hypothetical protein